MKGRSISTGIKRSRMDDVEDNVDTVILERRSDGTLIFPDYDEFRPSMLPNQVFRAGAFGGAYWRPIHSAVTSLNYSDQHKEFAGHFSGIPDRLLCAKKADVALNRYGVSSGQGLEAWEKSGWIKKQDPYGWMQWYCRFVHGRRSDDDKRQIQRWNNFCGPKGRFKRNLVNKIKSANAAHDDESISPVIRQGLLHWAYEITEADCKK